MAVSSRTERFRKKPALPFAFGLQSTASLLDTVTTIQIGNTGNYSKIRVWGSLRFTCISVFPVFLHCQVA